MAAQNNELPTTASKRDSLVNDRDGGSFSKDDQKDKPTRWRACPVTALLSLLILFLISGSGIAISVLIVHFDLQVLSAGIFDLVARILLFVASCMSTFYVLMHAFAAREQYVRNHGSPQIFGYFTVAVAVLIMRLGVPVWMGSVVLTAIVATIKGFNLAEGLQGNVVWVQLGIASLGFIFLLVMVVITETTERPFATSLFSKTSFIKTGTMSFGRVDTFDLSVSRAGFRPQGEGKGKVKSKGSAEVGPKQMGFDRSTINTPESPDFDSTDNPAMPILQAQGNTRPLVRIRSQPLPTPLESVFTAESSPLDVEDSPRKLGWRPPRESIYAPQTSQVKATSAGPRPPSDPRPPESPLGKRLSARASGQLELIANLGDKSTTPEQDTALPLSPSLETPIPIPARSPLRIANLDGDPTQSQGETPTLAKILGQLSSRAAARRRNSLLGRQADLITRQAASPTPAASETDMAAVLFDQPGDNVGAVQRRNSILVRQSDLDVRRSAGFTGTGEPSLYSYDQSTEFTDVPRPPKISSRATTVVEDGQGSEAPQLVRNFSRPGAPRPRTAGGEADSPGHQHTADQRGRSNARRQRALARRSRSLPSARQNPSRSAAEENNFKRNMSTSGRTNGSQPPAIPRFSPFPKTTVAESAKIKGLGQGSTKRLDERIEKWRDGVQVQKG